MSNGIDSLANGYGDDISNILRPNPDEVYEGQNFTGQIMPNQNVYDVGATGVVSTPAMFGTDSQDTLGTEQSFPLTSAPQVEFN